MTHKLTEDERRLLQIKRIKALKDAAQRRGAKGKPNYIRNFKPRRTS
jgi:hypothetical protein